jgi:hypothetical protein
MDEQAVITEDKAGHKREFLREQSKLLFGNRDRLEVAVAVARSEQNSVNATDLMQALSGWPNNRIRTQLVALAGVNLLKAMPRDGSGRIWYVRKDALFWAACIELAERWES